MQVTLEVAPEIKALADGIAGLISDIKAKKTVAQDTMDLVTALVPVIAAAALIPADLRRVDNQVYMFEALAMALETPVPASVI